MATRRRSAPYILRLGGLSHGTGEFFGQTVHNLTTTYRELQDVENLKKFADGDPETFLTYWEERKKSVKGKLKTQLEGLAAQAAKRVKVNKDDAAALTAYAKTNNHQVYLDYLLGKLDSETDPSIIARLGTQINELRSRVFATSTGSGTVGGGVTQDELVTTRDAWNETRMKYESIVRSRPLTADEVTAAKKAASDYETVLKKIVFSSDATQSRKDQMNTALTTSTGPNEGYLDGLVQTSDKKLLARFKTDADFAGTIAPLIAGKKYGEVAKMYAARARDLALLATQVQGPTQAEVIGNWLNDAEANVGKYTAQAGAESTKLSDSAQNTLDDGYSTYWSQQTKLHAKDPSKYIAPLEKGTWLRQLKNDDSAAQFSQDAGTAYSDATFKALQGAATSYGPAQYDNKTGAYVGDPAQVANARAADEAIRMAMNVPGGPYEVYKQAKLTDANSIRAIRDGTLTPEIAQSLVGYKVAPVQGSPEAAVQPDPTNPDASGAAPAAPAAGFNAAPVDGSPETSFPMFQTADPTAPSNGKPSGAQFSMATNGSQDDWTAALAGIDTYLTQYELADLPGWKPPVEKPVADVNSLFPFDSTPPPQTTTASDYPVQSGRPY